MPGDGTDTEQDVFRRRFAFTMGLRSVTAVVLVNGKGLAGWRMWPPVAR
jgi:hypothetical protein